MNKISRSKSNEWAIPTVCLRQRQLNRCALRSLREIKWPALLQGCTLPATDGLLPGPGRDLSLWIPTPGFGKRVLKVNRRFLQHPKVLGFQTRFLKNVLQSVENKRKRRCLWVLSKTSSPFWLCLHFAFLTVVSTWTPPPPTLPHTVSPGTLGQWLRGLKRVPSFEELAMMIIVPSHAVSAQYIHVEWGRPLMQSEDSGRTSGQRWPLPWIHTSEWEGVTPVKKGG